jgi:hypothetical protein
LLLHAGNQEYDVGEITWYGNPVPGYVFTFGKYKGLAIEDVIKQDPAYIQWAICNVAPMFIERFGAWSDYWDAITFKPENVRILTSKDFPEVPHRGLVKPFPQFSKVSARVEEEVSGQGRAPAGDEEDTMWDNPYPEYD